MDKQKLIELAEELLALEKLDKRTEDLLFLKRQYKILLVRDEETFYERQLTEKFTALYDELAKKEPKLNQSTFDEKKEIIELVKKLQDRKDIVKASRELDSLTLSFKKAGKCSKEQDDALWAEFREARDAFNEKKRAHFEELEKTNSERKARKEDIIARAKLLLNIKNLRESTEKMDALMEEWKAVGYAGKEDEALWKEFSGVRKEFNQKKREHHEELLKLFEERAAKKEQMIKDAKKLLADSDFSDEEVKKVRNMQKEFDKIGFAGKDKDDDLYARFNEVIKKYFEEKKFYTI